MTVRNEVTVQLNGQHSLSVRLGDVLQATSSLIVTTVYKHGSSELFAALQQKFGCQLEQERKLLPIEGGGYISFVEATKQSILCVRLPYTEGTKLPLKQFNQIIQATFSSIAMLLFEGKPLKTISLPMIGRKTIQNQSDEQTLKIYLHHASSSLRYADKLIHLTYYVLQQEQFDTCCRMLEEITYFNRNSPIPTSLVVAQNQRLLEQVEQFLQVNPFPILSQLAIALRKESVNSVVVRQLSLLNSYILQQVYTQVLPHVHLARPLQYPTKELIELNVLPKWYLNYFNYVQMLKREQIAVNEQSVETQLLYLTMSKRLLELLKVVQSGELGKVFNDAK